MTKIADFELRDIWRKAGGEFFGPHVEHGTMIEAKLLPFLRSLIERHRSPSATQWLKGVPEVEAGHCRKFLIAFRTSYMKPQHKTIVGEAWYLNAKELDTEDEQLIDANRDGEGGLFTGWHFLKEHLSYDEYYEAIGSDTTILGYQPLPEPPQ